jgi:hypothetical protein
MISAGDVTYRLDDTDLRRALHRFYARTKRTWPEILRSQSRLLAVNFAISTQPYGMGGDAQMKGESRVRKDIARVFPTPIAAGRGDANIRSPRLRARIEELLASEPEKALDVYAKVIAKRASAEGAPSRSFHQAQRNRRGRVGRRPATMVVTPDALERYTQSRQKLVGFVKSGWATVARLLGGARGIKRWVLRNKGPGLVQDNTGREGNPSIVISNEVTYASDVLPQREADKAAQIQADKMESAIRYALRADARAAGLKVA